MRDNRVFTFNITVVFDQSRDTIRETLFSDTILNYEKQ